MTDDTDELTHLIRDFERRILALDPRDVSEADRAALRTLMAELRAMVEDYAGGD